MRAAEGRLRMLPIRQHCASESARIGESPCRGDGRDLRDRGIGRVANAHDPKIPRNSRRTRPSHIRMS